MDQETVNEAVEIVTSYGLNVIGGIVILIVGWIVANWVAGMTRRALSRIPSVDATLTGFFASLTRYVILAFVIIAVLNQFGVQTTSIIAIFGAAGLAIGLALQGTLSNVAAGVMLLIFRPFRVGQYIEAGGRAGTVKNLGLFTTELATPDNVQIIVPNSAIWSGAVVNYSHHDTRRVDFLLGIAYGDSIDAALAIIGKVVDADERIHANPEPQIVVGELADSSVNIIVRLWVASGDYWPVKFDLTKAFKEALDAGGISIPFPQRDVHLIDHTAAQAAAG
jgi:small conductance mechanosensitive channel